MDSPRREAPRDQEESAFSAILRRLWDGAPSLLAAAFVDVEGECIDYVSRLPPFDAKVSAAHLHMLLELASASQSKLKLGAAFGLEVSGSEREAWVQRVAEDYMLIVVLAPGFDRTQLRDATALACAEFRLEVGLAAPGWEGTEQRLSVRVRPATGWKYAPEGYSDGRVRVSITDVLGRWTEPGGGGGDELVCFRVRTEDGQELTLVHDPDGNGWVTRETDL